MTTSLPPVPMVSRAVTLTRERIVAYAAAFDPQPQHLDEAAAAATGFGELVASGWQTASLSLRLAEEVCPPLGDGYRIESLKWQRPVRPGETLLVEVDALEPGRFRITTRDDQGVTVQVMQGIFLARGW